MPCVEDGPADFGLPFVFVVGFVRADEVVLADGAFDREGVISYVGRERSVGTVELCAVRSGVQGERKVDLGNIEGWTRPVGRTVSLHGTKMVALPWWWVNRSLA